MNQQVQDHQKACCADLYAKPVVSWLLGDSFHPGGSELTERLGRMLDLAPSVHALDIACGNGTSAILLAKRFGCEVVGIDLARPLISCARMAADRENLGALLDFVPGDAEALPFSEDSFDAIFSECAVSTFPDKHKPAREMARVLKPGGRLGFTDVVLANDIVSEILPGWFSQVACIGGACSAKQYRDIFESAGFSGWQEKDCPKELPALLRQVRMRLLALEVAGGIGKINVSGLDLSAAKKILAEVEKCARSGMMSYGIFVAGKEE
jgi:ubiquinone/menaquinone biosynthesis C-methylase UbiE